MTSKPGPEQCTKAALTMTLLHLGNGAAAAFSCQSQEQPAGGGQNVTLQKRSAGFPVRPLSGGSSQHHPALLTPTACRMSLLQPQSAAQSCCITWQTSPSFYCLPGVCSAPMGAVALHWESTGSHRHRRVAQDAPEQSQPWESFQIKVFSSRLSDTVFQCKKTVRKSNPS